MVVWKEALYTAGLTPKKQKKVIRAINRKRPVRNVYLITAPSNKGNCLEYMKANQILQPYFRKQELVVYGLAGSEDAAQELVASMLCGTYLATGAFEVVAYLDSKDGGKAGEFA